jgi:DNA modification methylase
MNIHLERRLEMRKEVIGNCELYCGDCLEILPAIRGVHAVITDPPYNFSTSANGAKHDLLSDMTNTAVFFKAVIQACLNTFPVQQGGTYWQFLNWKTFSALQKAVFDLHLAITSLLVWDKDVLNPGTIGLRPTYELVMLLCVGEAKIANRRLNDVWKIPYRLLERVHPAQKPLALLHRLVQETSGDVLLDPFMGSGTTGVACVDQGRRFIGMELHEGYFDTACKRIETAYKQERLALEE